MEQKQLIISVSREYASGGHQIAHILAEHFGIELYDINIMKHIAEERGLDHDLLKHYDEVPRRRIASRTVRGYSSSPEQNLANLQFDYLRSRAEEGKSFVAVGRCSEEVLRDYRCMIPIFVLADMEAKMRRVSEYEHISEMDAKVLIEHENRRRKTYHNYYCDSRWGDSRNYEISVNSSKLGIDETAAMLIRYVELRREMF